MNIHTRRDLCNGYVSFNVQMHQELGIEDYDRSKSKKRKRPGEGRSNSQEKAKRHGGAFIADAFTRDLK